jgi:predicted transcriptional regulator
MSLRRNRFEIWSEILEGCLRTCRTQSWLIRKVGVKTSVLKEALEAFEEKGLIEKVENTEVGLNFEFRTTKKGEQALLHYYELIT